MAVHKLVITATLLVKEDTADQAKVVIQQELPDFTNGLRATLDEVTSGIADPFEIASVQTLSNEQVAEELDERDCDEDYFDN